MNTKATTASSAMNINIDKNENQIHKSYMNCEKTKDKTQNDILEASRYALRIKLKNMKNKRTGAHIMYDPSGNMLLNNVYRRSFIINYLAKKKLMDAMGHGDEMSTIADIMKNN